MRCDIETLSETQKIISCTHFNGHHSIKQSCPKTSTISYCFSFSFFLLCVVFLQKFSLNLPLLFYGYTRPFDQRSSNGWRGCILFIFYHLYFHCLRFRRILIFAKTKKTKKEKVHADIKLL